MLNGEQRKTLFSFFSYATLVRIVANGFKRRKRMRHGREHIFTREQALSITTSQPRQQ